MQTSSRRKGPGASPSLSVGVVLVGLWSGWPVIALAADAHGHAAPPPAATPASAHGVVASPQASSLAAKAAPLAKPVATAVPTGGDLETLRQRLNARVADVRARQQTEDLHVVNVAPPRPAPRVGRAPLSSGHGSEHGAAVTAPRHGMVDVRGHDEEIHWGYGGAGSPDRWGSLKPEFNLCATGTRQSPIDIRDGIRVDLEPIRFDYRPSGFNVIDNGHTVQVNVGLGNTITVGQRRFELVQFHFHRPSEERINGRQYDMVAHLVHKDPEGRLAVVAVLMDQGKQHPVIQQIWSNLPLEKNVTEVASSAIDLNQLLPEDRRYFTYMGSLTTPPCSEGVLWLVLKQPAMVSPEQVGVFSRLYPMNARPIQRMANRLVKESP